MTLYFYRHNGQEHKRMQNCDKARFRAIGSLHTIHVNGNVFSNFRVVDADNDTVILQEC